jgi:hypothetical protein
METKYKRLKKILGSWGFRQLVGTTFAIAIACGTAYNLNKNSRENRERYYGAIQASTMTITNNSQVYYAHVEDISLGHGFSRRKIFIEGKGPEGIHGRLVGTDYSKDISIDEVEISQVPLGSPLEKLTLREVREIYSLFTNSIDESGRIIHINAESKSCEQEVQAIEERTLGRKLTSHELSLLENVDEETKDLARQVSMRDYKPIGNGGALSASYGKISPERRYMQRAIGERYLVLLNLPLNELRRM